MRRNTGEALGSPSGGLLAYPVGVAAEDERNYLVLLREGMTYTPPAPRGELHVAAGLIWELIL